MPVFTVTTEEDLRPVDTLGNPNEFTLEDALLDGVVSLREAIELAADNDLIARNDWIFAGRPAGQFPQPIDDEIRFAEGIETIRLTGRSGPSSPGPDPLGEQNVLDAAVTIDGDADGDGIGDVVIDGQGVTSHFVIRDDTVLRNLTLANGFVDRRGENDPVAGEESGADGRDAAGSIEVAFHSLVLDRVSFVNNKAYAAHGARGTRGADGTDGAAGGSGANASFSNDSTPGGAGAPGTAGADGGDGGDGGDAAGAILVSGGDLTLIDVAFDGGNWAQAGDGGSPGLGGRGGNGGDGGRGGRSGGFDTTGSPGGKGGKAGDGGRNGALGEPGDAAHLILNKIQFDVIRGDLEGEVFVETPLAVGALAPGAPATNDNTITGGFGPGTPGDGGPGGASTIGSAADGPRGDAGTLFHRAENTQELFGRHEQVSIAVDGAEPVPEFEQVSAIVFAALSAAETAEDDAVTLSIHRMGDASGPLEVDWKLRGPARRDFDRSDRTGTAVFEADERTVQVELTPRFNGRDEGARSLKVMLEEIDDDGARASGTRVEARVVDGAGDGDDRIRGTKRADDLAAGKGDDVVRGRGGKDSLAGEQGHDRLFGQNGRDDLDGGGGRDRLVGGGGRDDLRGGGGRDKLVGGGGRDVVDGDRGADVLKGGGGRDEFHFARGDGKDVIKDFRAGKDDISIKGVDRFGQLDIEQKGKHVIIDHGRRSDEIKLLRTDADDLDAGDFVFG